MTTHALNPRWTAILAVALGILLTSTGAAPAFAGDVEDAPAAAPQLSITISDDLDETDADQELAYTIVIENIGTTDALGLIITQSVPDGMTFGSADSEGTLAAGVVSWTLDLAAAGSATVATTMTVGKTPADLLRLATVACAHATVKGPPVVCAADSDLLPAGALVESTSDPASTTPAGIPAWWIAGGIAAVLVVSALGAVLVLRKLRRGAAGRAP